MNQDDKKTVHPSVEEMKVEAEYDVIDNAATAKDGQTKCPKCGATDIATNHKTGKLRCQFCRYEFEAEKVFEQGDEIENLEGVLIGSGAKDIQKDFEDIVTLKCESCGAEVVIDTSQETHARCHWCRNTLSINNKLPNGAVPDAILPFTVPKTNAQAKINSFVGKRKFFAHPTFTREFTTDNIMAVYLPYLLVDVNGHAKFSGTGEKLVRKYEVSVGDNKKETRYDADAFHVEREFDIAIDDLTIEASKDKLDVRSHQKTANIINAIMPFDTENCVAFDANFLKNASSEKRDVDISQLRQLAQNQAKDVAKFAAKETAQYNRGIAWDREEFDIKGEAWNAVYLPIWLYSYMERKGSKQLIHYVAVNARTEETMGSVPIHMSKLIVVSFLVTLLGGLAAIVAGLLDVDSDWRWLLLFSGVLFYLFIYNTYRNAGARHSYESETKSKMKNLIQEDVFMEHRRGLKNSKIAGRNDDTLSGNRFTLF